MVGGGDNITSLLDIPGVDAGDTIRIWGVEGYTYEGGITIDKPNVRIMRWEGSPARPLITNSSGTVPAITILADNGTLQGLNISNNNFSSKNEFSSSNGAGVYVSGAYKKNLQKLTVMDCVFMGNQMTEAYSYGGAICLKYVDNSRITSTVFENNRAKWFGGGMYLVRSGNAILKNVAFKENSASYKGGGAYFGYSANATLTNISFENNMGRESTGGAYFDNSCQANLTNVTFKDNTANWGTGAYFDESANATLKAVSFEGNTAAQSGGGAYFFKSSNSTLTDTSFERNKAKFSGGGLVFACSDGIVLSGATFKDNTAYHDKYSYYGNGGGAYFVASANSILTGTSFENNTASCNGGGLRFGTSDRVILKNVSFEGNNANSEGGGLYFGNSDNITLSAVSFEANTAAEAGGGSYFIRCDNATLTNMTFKNNTAKFGGGSCFSGVYTYSFDSKTLHYIRTPTLKNMSFEGNNAIESGGGSYFLWSENATLTDMTFKNNTAELGGGSYFNNSNGTVIKNCFFENEKNLYAESSSAKALNEKTPIPGSNIAGGQYLGGNVWLRDPAQSISERGADADLDGICDQSLIIKCFNGTGTCIGDFGTDAFPLIYKTGSLIPPADDDPEDDDSADDDNNASGQKKQSSGRRILAKGSHASFRVGSSAIYEVGVTAKETVTYSFFTVNKMSLPAGGVPPTDAIAVYEYDEITHPQVPNSVLANVTLNFSVPKAWLKENGFAPEDVVLYRYQNESWQALETELLDEDTTYVRFCAKTPGFSLFAIGVRASIPEPELPATPKEAAPVSTQAEPDTPDIPQKSPVWYGEVLLAIGAAYSLKKRRV